MSRSRKSIQFCIRVPYDLAENVQDMVSDEVTATDVICDALEVYFAARSVMKNV